MIGFWNFMVLELEWWIDGWMDYTDHTDHMDGYNYQSSCGAKKQVIHQMSGILTPASLVCLKANFVFGPENSEGKSKSLQE